MNNISEILYLIKFPNAAEEVAIKGPISLQQIKDKTLCCYYPIDPYAQGYFIWKGVINLDSKLQWGNCFKISEKEASEFNAKPKKQLEFL